MTDTIHIMLDLETWGKRPGCDLRSIGACVFDPVTGNVGGVTSDGTRYSFSEQAGTTFYVATSMPMTDTYCSQGRNGEVIHHPHHGERFKPKYALTRDPETVQWWSDQSDEAKAAFISPIDIKEALIAFADWFDVITVTSASDQPQHRQHVRLWSHGPAFDPPILAAAYEACGLPAPWHYRAPRDTRTAFDMAYIDDHSAWLQQFNTGTWHHALDDAISQARAVCAAYARQYDNRDDITTHREAWRNCIIHARSCAEDDANRLYYQHQLETFDRVFAALTGRTQMDCIRGWISNPQITITPKPQGQTFNPDASIVKTITDFAEALKGGNFPNIAGALDARMCCDGQMCGCQGSTVGEYLAYEFDQAFQHHLMERNEPSSIPVPQNCTIPPKGYYCTRDPGHDGPCAARPMIYHDDGK